jgi:putative integral membrane protein (TIGR02587 family)
MASDSLRMAQGTARAFGGALLFAFPLLMTMEMWQLGYAAHPARLALFLALSIPALVALSHYSGFEATFGWREDVMDAFAAIAIGAVTAALMLSLFGLVGPGQSVTELNGTIAIQTVPAAIGAMVARRQFAGDRGQGPTDEEGPASYAGELFLMGMGAFYVAFNVAPTEEMVAIAYTMTPLHSAALLLLSLTVLHAIVYAVGFRGQHAPERDSQLSLVLHFTLPGYAVALAMSLYVLWTFGRLDGVGIEETISTVTVLGFPASLGAAVARLVV